MMADFETRAILEAVPEFVGRFLNLLAQADADPGAAAVFTELADFIACEIAQGGGSATVLARCTVGLEQVAAESEDAEELVTWAFFDHLCAADLRVLEPWLGPLARSLLDRLTLP